MEIVEGAGDDGQARLRAVGQQEEAIGQIGQVGVARLPRTVGQLQQEVGRTANGGIAPLQPQERFVRLLAQPPVEARGLGGRGLRLAGQHKGATQQQHGGHAD